MADPLWVVVQGPRLLLPVALRSSTHGSKVQLACLCGQTCQRGKGMKGWEVFRGRPRSGPRQFVHIPLATWPHRMLLTVGSRTYLCVWEEEELGLNSLCHPSLVAFVILSLLPCTAVVKFGWGWAYPQLHASLWHPLGPSYWFSNR